MKTIKSYILERLILKKQSKLSTSELKKVVDIISNILDIEGYANQPDSEDDFNNIINGIKESILLTGISTPCFFTNSSYYSELVDYDGIDIDKITKVSDNSFDKLYNEINYKNAERVFESNDTYGLNIYANEYGINFRFYQDSIFVIDTNNEIIKDIEIEDEEY